MIGGNRAQLLRCTVLAAVACSAIAAVYPSVARADQRCKVARIAGAETQVRAVAVRGASCPTAWSVTRDFMSGKGTFVAGAHGMSDSYTRVRGWRCSLGTGVLRCTRGRARLQANTTAVPTAYPLDLDWDR